jgi:hypothetical protein
VRFNQYGVQLVLAGHDHDYQRSEAINGITYVVSGAGSRTTDQPRRFHRRGVVDPTLHRHPGMGKTTCSCKPSSRTAWSTTPSNYSYDDRPRPPDRRDVVTGQGHLSRRSGSFSAGPAPRAHREAITATTPRKVTQMPDSTKFTRRHKLLLASLATVSLSLGGASLVSAAQSPPATNDSPVGEEVDGVDCVDGIDAATGAECDGGPTANPINDPNEADTEEGTEAEEADEADDADEVDEVDGVDCEDGIDAATGAECDGGPAAKTDDDPTESDAEDSTEASGN